MEYLPNICFAIALFIGIAYFTRNVKKLIRNIKLGLDVEVVDQKPLRWKNMLMVALGQSKMVKRPIAGMLHIIVYLGFIIINIEILEIVIDGLVGTHRVGLKVLPVHVYGVLIGTFEILAVLVFVAVIVFWLRRNTIKLQRFWNSEMTSWPKNDANYILYFEMVLMALFIVMNATDVNFQSLNSGNIVSQFVADWFSGLPVNTLHVIERTAWWLHILGVLIFLNYLYFSKHLHILLAFPNTYYAKLSPNGKLNNLESVTNEVKMMLDPNIDPFATPPEGTSSEVPAKFGASDVQDLSWVQLLNAYTCTECGRCTSVCPANQTGKLLSPRKVMMDTRDRLEEYGKNLDAKTEEKNQEKDLHSYISEEELWACTTCNACTDICPVNIDPMNIIYQMRQYLVMEKSTAPNELNMMFTNVENNGAPWQFSAMDRANWKDE